MENKVNNPGRHVTTTNRSSSSDRVKSQVNSSPKRVQRPSNRRVVTNQKASSLPETGGSSSGIASAHRRSKSTSNFMRDKTYVTPKITNHDWGSLNGTTTATNHDRLHTSPKKSAPRAKSARTVKSKSSKSGLETPQFNFDRCVFDTVRSPRRIDFTIHPEWVSESLSVQKLSLRDRTATYPPRRCRSAPPPTIRNPITWEEYSYTQTYRR